MVATLPLGIFERTPARNAGSSNLYGSSWCSDKRWGATALTVTPRPDHSTARVLVSIFTPTFGGAIDSFLGYGDNRSLTADIYDPTLATTKHPFPNSLATEEGSLEVQIHHPVPIILSDIFCRNGVTHTCIVHEDVDASHLLFHRFYAGSDRRHIPEVKGKDFTYSAFFSDLLSKALQAGNVS